MIRFISILTLLLYFSTVQFGQAKSNSDNTSFQNLVINSSFEEPILTVHKKNVVSSIDTLDKMLGWNSLASNKAMVYKSDSNGYVVDFAAPGQRNFKAKSGKNVAAINVFGKIRKDQIKDDTEYRSYILGELKKTLTIGQKYYVGFFIHYHCLATNRVGLAMVNDTFNVIRDIKNLTPLMYQKRIINYDVNNIWSMVVDSFIATEQYKSIAIGNFFCDDSTKIGGSKDFNHYLAYIDDVFVYEARTKTMPLKEKMQPYLPNSFNNINFEYNSSKLDYNSQLILDSIAKIMVSFSEIKILIKGYTSGEGEINNNQRLSELRAKVVCDYLILNGISSNRLKSTGLGSSKPLVSESSEENKKKNRRIEFEIIKE